jgi:hypothetical protein
VAYNSGPGNVVGEVSSERPHSGSKSFKITFRNQDGGTVTWRQQVKIEFPGQEYELSFWYFSANSGASNRIQGGIQGGGSYTSVNNQLINAPAGQWMRASVRFTPVVSIAHVELLFGCGVGTRGNVVYVDDVGLERVTSG